MFDTSVAWHYTPASNLKGIIEAGALLPSVATCWTGHPSTLPHILFNTNEDRFTWHWAVGHQIEEAGGYWLRFGYNGPDAVSVSKTPGLFLDINHFMPSLESRLISEGYDGRETPKWLTPLHRDFVSGWRVVVGRSIAVDEFARIEASDDDGHSWRRLWTNPHRAAGFPPFPLTQEQHACRQ